LTGWTPQTSLSDTVRQIARWWKANQHLFGRVQDRLELGTGFEAVQEPA
jgi:dTDP-D-glucose 4,6-dehydratase